MENTKQLVNVYEPKALAILVAETLTQIKEWSDKQNYRVEFELDKKALLEELEGSSKRTMKQINNGIRHFNAHPSLKSANRFLHTIFRKLLEANTVKIKVSEKEEKIQLARKAWKDAMKKAEELRLAYKEEKAGFYKKA